MTKVKSKYYVTEVNYSKRSMKIVDVITMSADFDYYDRYKEAFRSDLDDENIGYYASKDKNHRWSV